MLNPLHIPGTYRGQRLDLVLAQLYPTYSRSQLSRWLKTGEILINQQLGKPKDNVIGGELITFHIEIIPDLDHPQAEEIPLDIIFEDEYLLVLNKPAGLVVHPGAGNREHTLVNALLHHSPCLHHLPRAGIIHRLDKDTTGLLIVAKTLESHTLLIRQMQARAIERHYLTLVYGHVIAGGTIETAYGRDPHNRLKMAVRAQGKEAITQYWVKKHYQYATLLEVKLQTGRTHQIRVHMAHIQHPAVGDPLYRRNIHLAEMTPHVRQALGEFKRQALHAYYLHFVHPITHSKLKLSAPLAEDFTQLLHVLDSECA